MPEHEEAIAAPPGQYWDIDAITAELREAREEWRNAHRRHAEHGAEGFPSRHVIEKVMAALVGALFPLRLGPSFVRRHNEEAFVAETLQTALSRLYGQIRLELGYAAGTATPLLIDEDAGRIISHFARALHRLRLLVPARSSNLDRAARCRARDDRWPARAGRAQPRLPDDRLVGAGRRP